jgi:hypothetical protein
LALGEQPGCWVQSLPVPQALPEPHDFHRSAVKNGAPPFPKMYVPGLVDPCRHPSFCAAYTTGAELALADAAANAVPASTVPSRTIAASSLLTIVDVLATELSPPPMAAILAPS